MKLKNILLIIVIIFLFIGIYLVGGYVGFNNGYTHRAMDINSCISESKPNYNFDSLIKVEYLIKGNYTDLIVGNISKCLNFNGVEIFFDLIKNENSKELKISLDNSLFAGEKSVIVLDKIEFDTLVFKNITYSGISF